MATPQTTSITDLKRPSFLLKRESAVTSVEADSDDKGDRATPRQNSNLSNISELTQSSPTETPRVSTADAGIAEITASCTNNDSSSRRNNAVSMADNGNSGTTSNSQAMVRVLSGARTISAETDETSHEIDDTAEGKSPGAVSRERRAEIWKVLRKAIPAFAQERRRQFSKNAEYAALCILDAFQGRLKNGLASNSKKSKWIYTIFSIQTSKTLLKMVVYGCAFHTLSIFFEPENACSNSWIYYLIQLAIISIYAFDIALKMSYEGLKEYWGHNWQQLYVIVTALMALDLLVCGCSYYSNPLRPVVGILRARNGRRFFEILKKMVPGMSHSLIPLLFFVLLVMVCSTLLFDKHIPEFSSSTFASYNWAFLIFTNDNFDRVLPEHMRMNMYYLIFFFPVIYVGQQFLLSLIIGETYETYKSFVKKQLKKERLKELQGLTKAFSALDEEKTGSISSLVWRECLTKLDPDIPPEAIALYFELIAGGGNTVGVLQFLSLRSVLQFNLRLKGQRKNTVIGRMISTFYDPVKDRAKAMYKSFEVPVSDTIVKFSTEVMKLIEKANLLNKINNFDIVVLCLSLSDYPLFVVLGSTITPCLMVNFLYLLEFLLRLAQNGGKLHVLRQKKSWVGTLFLLGVLGRFFCMFLQLRFHIDSATRLSLSIYEYMHIDVSFEFRKAILFSRALRCVRLANLNHDLRNFSAALLDVFPALFETFGFTFIVTYIFGAAGNLLFGQHLSEWRTPLLAVVKVQQLSLGVDFLSSMEEAIEHVHIASISFFVFYLILAMAVSNIALSIIIDLQNNVLDSKSNKERAGQAGRMDVVFEKIVSQARTRAALDYYGMSKTPLNFSNIVMSPFQSSDVRHFITSGDGDSAGGGLNIDDIKQCDKQSNIDLVAHFAKEHKNHKDMHWEVDFLNRVEESGIPGKKQMQSGTVLFKEGDAAHSVFLLLDGSVNLTHRLEPQCPAIIQGLHFVGAEGLQPSGRYSYTCTVDGLITCVEITQEHMAEELDSETCGDMLRMSFKSIEKIVEAFKEARRRSEIRKSRRFGNKWHARIAKKGLGTGGGTTATTGTVTTPTGASISSSPSTADSTPATTPSTTPASTPTIFSRLQEEPMVQQAQHAQAVGVSGSSSWSASSSSKDNSPVVHALTPTALAQQQQQQQQQQAQQSEKEPQAQSQEKETTAAVAAASSVGTPTEPLQFMFGDAPKVTPEQSAQSPQQQQQQSNNDNNNTSTERKKHPSHAHLLLERSNSGLFDTTLSRSSSPSTPVSTAVPRAAVTAEAAPLGLPSVPLQTPVLRSNTLMRVLSDQVTFAPSSQAMDREEDTRQQQQQHQQQDADNADNVDSNANANEDDSISEDSHSHCGTWRTINPGKAAEKNNPNPPEESETSSSTSISNNSNSGKNKKKKKGKQNKANKVKMVTVPTEIVTPIPVTPIGPNAAPTGFFSDTPISSNTATQAATIERELTRTSSGKENATHTHTTTGATATGASAVGAVAGGSSVSSSTGTASGGEGGSDSSAVNGGPSGCSSSSPTGKPSRWASVRHDT